MLWSEEEEEYCCDGIGVLVKYVFVGSRTHDSLSHPPTYSPTQFCGWDSTIFVLEYNFPSISHDPLTHSLTHFGQRKGRKEGEREGERELLASSLPTCPMPAFQAKQSLEGGKIVLKWWGRVRGNGASSSPSESMSNMRERLELKGDPCWVGWALKHSQKIVPLRCLGKELLGIFPKWKVPDQEEGLVEGPFSSLKGQFCREELQTTFLERSSHIFFSFFALWCLLSHGQPQKETLERSY